MFPNDFEWFDYFNFIKERTILLAESHTTAKRPMLVLLAQHNKCMTLRHVSYRIGKTQLVNSKGIETRVRITENGVFPGP